MHRVVRLEIGIGQLADAMRRPAYRIGGDALGGALAQDVLALTVAEIGRDPDLVVGVFWRGVPLGALVDEAPQALAADDEAIPHGQVVDGPGGDDQPIADQQRRRQPGPALALGQAQVRDDRQREQ